MKDEKLVCGYAFRNKKTGLFAEKGLNGWDKKLYIWSKESHIKGLITGKIKEYSYYGSEWSNTLKEEYLQCEIIEVIIHAGNSKSVLFNLDWLNK